MTSDDILPTGWEYEGIAASRHGDGESRQARRKISPGYEIVIQAKSREELISRMMTYDRTNNPSGMIRILESDARSMFNELEHLRSQVLSLQQTGTIREEQLRTYRKLELSEEQKLELNPSLYRATRACMEKYGMDISAESVSRNMVLHTK